jgi:hypothetical protein
MKKREWIIALAVLGAFLILRGSDLFGPFILPFETAFQEAIALHHLRNGIAADHFLPVIATIDGQNFYHTSHPPLLHIIYALMYKSVGVHEWVTRFFSLGLYFLSALTWRAMLGKNEAQGWFIFAAAFALPIPALLCTTTNYEMLSMFFISLIAWLVLSKEAGPAALASVLTIGMLADWPVYLAVPAIALMKWRDPRLRRLLLGLFAYEIVFFAALQAYCFSVTGEAAFFTHSPERANPAAIFALETWMMLGSHFAGVMGLPLVLVSAAALASWIVYAARRRESGPLPFFALFTLLLLGSAFRLVSLHFVYLLYFTPLLVMALHHALKRLTPAWPAMAAVIALCAGRDYIQFQHRNPANFGAADRLKSAGLKTAFASSAVGVWYFYDNIQTVHPVSIAGADWIKTHEPDLVQMDSASMEAHKSLAWQDYQTLFQFPGESVYIKRERARLLPRYLLTRRSDFIMTGPGRDCRAGTWIQTRPYYGANVTSCRVASYAVSEPPGPWWARLAARLDGAAQHLSVRPGIVHALPFARSDGIAFMAMAGYADNADGPRLLFARFMTDKETPPAQNLDLAGADNIILVTTAGPKNNASFDDAYWVEPILRMSGEAE